MNAGVSSDSLKNIKKLNKTEISFQQVSNELVSQSEFKIK